MGLEFGMKSQVGKRSREFLQDLVLCHIALFAYICWNGTGEMKSLLCEMKTT